MSRLRSVLGAGVLGGGLLLASTLLSGDAVAQPGQAQPEPPARQQRLPPPGGQAGRPQIQPGMPPGFDPNAGRRPMRPLPDGHPPVGAQATASAAPPAKPVTPKDEHGHCPGHGAMDSLWANSHINWYQGLLGVDNAKAKSASFADRLMWRYHNPDDECDAANQQPPVLAAVFNFLVLLLLFVKFGKKPLAEALAKRKKGIVEDMVAAKAQGDEAEERLERYEAQLGKLEDRRLEVQEESALQWQSEKKRILGEAEERRGRMRRDAELRVDQELKAAQQELLREAIEGAAKAAEQLIATRLDARDHERLADEYLASVADVVRSSDLVRKDARAAAPASGAAS